MQKLMTFVQLITWLTVATYFAVLIGEHTRIKPSKNDIVAQLEQQVNFEQTGYE